MTQILGGGSEEEDLKTQSGAVRCWTNPGFSSSLHKDSVGQLLGSGSPGLHRSYFEPPKEERINVFLDNFFLD